MDNRVHEGWVNQSFTLESQIDLPNYIRFSRRNSTPDPSMSALPVNGCRRQSLHSAPLPSPHRTTQTNGVSWADVALNNNKDGGFDKSQRKDSLSDDPHDVEYSKAVDVLGFGKFHLALAFVCGFMYLAAALQNNLNAYILSSVSCEFDLSSSQLGLLNAMFLIGGIVSNLMWGIIADVLGRKTVVVYGMLFDGLLSLVCSLSQHFEMLLACRFLNGFIVGGPATLVFNYMGEFFPDRMRRTAICYVGAFWTLSWAVMPGLAWLIIPIQWSYQSNSFVFNSWRILVALLALPSLTSAALLHMFPESPQILLTQGKSLKALEVLRRIYSINHGENSGQYPVKSLKEPLLTKQTNDEDHKSIFHPVKVVAEQLKSLFSIPTVFTTLLASFLFFSNMFGYYGLGLWMPELYNRMNSQQDLDSEMEKSVCIAQLTVNTTSTESCDPTDVDVNVFTTSVMIGAVALLGNILSGVLANRLQRRTLPAILVAGTALCVVAIYFLTSLTFYMIIWSIFQLTVGTTNSIYSSLVVDMFPPNVSGVGMSISVMSGRIGGMISNLIIGHFLDTHCSVPFFVVAAVLAAGCFVTLLIPNKPYSQSSSSTSEQKLNDPVFVTT